MGLGHGAAISIGNWFARYTGLGMFLAYSGAFFTLTYSPLKTLIMGTPKKLWPKKFTELNAKLCYVGSMCDRCCDYFDRFIRYTRSISILQYFDIDGERFNDIALLVLDLCVP